MTTVADKTWSALLDEIERLKKANAALAARLATNVRVVIEIVPVPTEQAEEDDD